MAHAIRIHVITYTNLHSRSIFYSSSAKPVLTITSTVKPVYMEQYTLTCRATFIPKIASQLIPYLVLEWFGPDGIAMTEENGVTIEQQQNLYSEATRSLTFHPLNMTHGGSYTCEAKFVLQDLNSTISSTSQYNLNVLSKCQRIS